MLQALTVGFSLVLFGYFLWVYVSRFAAALYAIGIVHVVFPYYTESSKNAIPIFVAGFGWYAALILFAKTCPKLINYALCAAAILHTCLIANGFNLMTNPNEQSAFFALCAPSFLSLWAYSSWLIIFPIAGLALTQSFNGVAATGLVLMIYFVVVMPWKWSVLLLCVVVAVAVYYLKYVYIKESPGVEQRLSYWIPALELFWKKKMGCGLGNWKELSGVLVHRGHIPDGCYRLHNTFVQGVLELGFWFAGVVVLYAAYCAYYVRRIHISHTLGLVAFLVVANCNSLYQMNIVNGVVATALLARCELAIRQVRNK